MNTVFVYGTLQGGLHNHGVMQRAGGLFDGFAHTKDPLPLEVSSLPYLHDMPGKGLQVEGELYSVPDYGMGILDALEGHPTFYCRREIEIVRDDAKASTVLAWCYFIKTRPRPRGKLHASYRSLVTRKHDTLGR